MAVRFDPNDQLSNQLRKVKPEGITPLDVGDQGATYRACAQGVECVLYRKHGVYEIITGATPLPARQPDDPAVLEWDIWDKAAVIFLFQFMTTERREQIPLTYSAAQIWAQLRASATAYTMESLHATLSAFMDIRFDPAKEDVKPSRPGSRVHSTSWKSPWTVTGTRSTG